MQPRKLSLKPGIQTPVSPEDAMSWVENRNGVDLEEKPAISGKVKRITFQVSGEQHQAIKIRATQKEMTITELMLSLIEKALEQKI